MMRSKLLDKLYLMKLDTSVLREETKPGYQYALNEVIKYVKEQPMDRDEAAQILLDWIDFACDSETSPNDPPHTDQDILEAMRMGAEALKK